MIVATVVRMYLPYCRSNAQTQSTAALTARVDIAALPSFELKQIKLKLESYATFVHRLRPFIPILSGKTFYIYSGYIL